MCCDSYVGGAQLTSHIHAMQTQDNEGLIAGKKCSDIFVAPVIVNTLLLPVLNNLTTFVVEVSS